MSMRSSTRRRPSPRTGPALPAVALAALALAAPAAVAADVIHVPAEVHDLQQAIDGAAPGDIVVVTGGSWAPIRIEQPIRIVGALGGPKPFLRVPEPGDPGAAAVTLAGPGAGLVVLGNLEIGGEVDGAFFDTAHPAIVGGGFDELVVTDCVIEAGEWVSTTLPLDGAHAIDVDLPLLAVETSLVTGGRGTSALSGLFIAILPAPGDGIRCTGRVVVNNSVVAGGAGYDESFSDGVLCSLKVTVCELFPPEAGVGGVAVVAASVRDGGSSLEGGAGTQLTCIDGGVTCAFADGPAVVAPDVEVETSFLVTVPTTPSAGSALGVAYNSTVGSPSVYGVVASLAPTLPVVVPAGELYADPSSLAVVFAPGGGGLLLADFTLPRDVRLTGAAFVVQVWDPFEGLSMPRHGIVSEFP